MATNTPVISAFATAPPSRKYRRGHKWPPTWFSQLKYKDCRRLPHWYLAVIGSDTSVRGKGYGQALMRSRLDRVDAEHAPAYLESSKPENVPYYQRFGFEVTGEIVVPNGGPTLWPMWRAPR